MTKLDCNLVPAASPTPIAVAPLKILKGDIRKLEVLDTTRPMLTITRTLFDAEAGVIDALNPKSTKESILAVDVVSVFEACTTCKIFPPVPDGNVTVLPVRSSVDAR